MLVFFILPTLHQNLCDHLLQQRDQLFEAKAKEQEALALQVIVVEEISI